MWWLGLLLVSLMYDVSENYNNDVRKFMKYIYIIHHLFCYEKTHLFVEF